ncbi:MAG: DNA mismatch endonuclease Vsr, partial [Candidatus Hydrogenedentes bacterium]|nr:DNA mismatch endonuclease Vsr [Candidatus Hydrogenedentota bacterium]
YRIHVTALPGCPDIVLRQRKKAIFVHGCFWHGHSCKRGARTPKTHVKYWTGKIARNRSRDRTVIRALRSLGWGVMVVWECQLRNIEHVEKRLLHFLGGHGDTARR